MDVQTVEVAEGIYEIHVDTTVAVSCSCYLVKAAKPALIETGPACQVGGIMHALTTTGHVPSYIIVSHNHFDHCGGIGQLVADLPGATVVAHEETVHHLVDPTRLIKGIKRVFGDDFEQVYGAVLPVPEGRIRSVRDASVISLGDRELHVVHTPGHVGHHISLYDPLSRSLFLGDGLGGRDICGAEFGPTAAPPDFDMEVELETIEKIKRLAPSILCFAHFGTTRDVKRILQLAEQTTRG